MPNNAVLHNHDGILSVIHVVNLDFRQGETARRFDATEETCDLGHRNPEERGQGTTFQGRKVLRG
jgi:hypothetical protein